MSQKQQVHTHAPQQIDGCALLRERGLRMTQQRRLVMEALQVMGKPVCAPCIWGWIQQRNSQINKSTIYRTVEMLKELGVLNSADLGSGRIQYEISSTHKHHHLVCEVCSTVIEIDDEPLKNLHDQLLTRYGFLSSMKHLAITGRCVRCAAQSEPK